MDFGNRRPSYPIEAPAIARHVVFRLRQDENPRWHTHHDDEARWAAIIKCFTTHVQTLRQRFGNEGDFTLVGPDQRGDPENERYCLRGSCIIPVTREGGAGYRFRIRLDVHTELSTVTYLFDRCDKSAQAADSPLGQLASLPSDTSVLRPLFDTIWTDSAEGTPATEAISAWLADEGDIPPRRCAGTLIADFRSIILAAGEEAPVPELGEPMFVRHEQAPLSPAIRGFIARHRGLIQSAIAPREALAGTESAAEPMPAGSRGGARGEPVVCGMLDGDALYAARLGQWNQTGEGIEPIRHLVVYSGDCAEQLGRLVRRLHVLGQLRHAALIDFEPDSEFDAPTELDIELDRELGVKDRNRSFAAGTDSTGGDSTQPLGRGGLRAASRVMRKVGELVSRDSAKLANPKATLPYLEKAIPWLARINGLVEGGLTYRVERARYYHGEFRDMIRHLRLVKLRDWVSYNDFADRHILHLLERVDHIGRRYEALTRRVHRLLAFKQSQRLGAYTDTVEASLTALGENTRALQERSESQNELLRFGEGFALVFGIYYVGYVLLHLYEVRGPMGAVISKDLFLIGWAVLISGAAAVLAVRWIQAHRRAAGRRRPAVESTAPENARAVEGSEQKIA